MRRLRRTKIVATLGPASSDRNVIASLFRAGADVFRINMSHTSHDRMRELVAAIRAVEFEYGRPIGILVDLQGPKLRVGKFAERTGHAYQGRDIHARFRSVARRHRRASTFRIRKSSPRPSQATRC